MGGWAVEQTTEGAVTTVLGLLDHGITSEGEGMLVWINPASWETVTVTPMFEVMVMLMCEGTNQCQWCSGLLLLVMYVDVTYVQKQSVFHIPCLFICT